ncbi:hypothetical protein AVEN_146786-1 [Araneus ventricosus]|uniref:STPR domain-containing protein n=1 Tax=Araneus ventricosus TaxID=182803 RepID=A0A4Y2D9P3_ARAVE|nr:hypothetical protein AVEN_146786-1 [Araneus ventricosus]
MGSRALQALEKQMTWLTRENRGGLSGIEKRRWCNQSTALRRAKVWSETEKRGITGDAASRREAIRKRERRVVETEEERSRRLSTMAQRGQDRRAEETEEQRNSRLSDMAQRRQERRAEETEEQRNRRLAVMGQRSQQRSRRNRRTKK